MAQTTGFIYQGSLNSGGVVANGNHDFEFALFTTETVGTGTQLGATLPQNGVAVTNGIFAVSLDFGSQFPGAQRFLEIRVRPTGGGAFTPLVPRQLINSAPYSVKSLSADTAANATNATNAVNATTATNATQLGGVAANQYVITTDARMSDARNPLPGNFNYIQNQSVLPQPGAFFNIGGTGLANQFDAATQYNIGGSRVLSIAGDNNIFAGASAGGVNTTGFLNAFFGSSAGRFNLAGARNSFFGTAAGGNNTTGSQNSFFGNAAGFNSKSDANSFFGNAAGFSNTTGSFNSFFGQDAGFSNTTGGDNAFFGRVAGYNNTGSSNAFFGSFAGEANRGPCCNSFFGSEAGRSTTFGGFNSFFGSEAGQANTTGASNTIIGTKANVGSGALNFATALGADAIVSTSNTVVLGRNLDTVQVPGNLNVTGTFTGNINGAGITNLNASNLSTGTLDAARLPVPLTLSGTSATHIIRGENASTTSFSTGVYGRATAGTGLAFGVYGVSDSTGGRGVFGDATNGSGLTYGVYGQSNSMGGRGVFGWALAGTGVTYGGLFQSNSTGGTGVFGVAIAGSGINYGVYGTTGSPSGYAGYFTGPAGSRNYFERSVGIGTTDPSAPLHVQQNADLGNWQNSQLRVSGSTNPNMQLNLGYDTVNDRGLIQAGNATLFFTNLLLNPNGGNVGIGTFAAAQKLDVSGNIRLGTGTNGCVEDRDGTLIAGVCSSDLRFKRNITPFGSILNSFSKLRPVNYYWRADEFADKHFGERQSFGLIAQEVEQVFPELVSTDEQGYKLVNYSKLPLLTIQAVNEQQSQIEELGKQNQSQQKQIERQQTQIRALALLVCRDNKDAGICKEQ